MRCILLIPVLLVSAIAHAQIRPAIATDFTVQRNFSPDQEYWAIGQTLRGEWYDKGRTAFYAGVSYFNRGRFRNQLEAEAKDPVTSPSAINYTNTARMRFTQISLGLKPYIKGRANAEEGWNLYTLMGLGVLMGRVDNIHSARIDTAQYHVAVLAGRGRFRRLTLDLGLGVEAPVGGNLFLYAEGKTFIPVTYFPSNYILNSKYTPLTVNLCLGVRMLF